MSKHTPGPWTAERLYQALNGHASPAEARLIAAAPDLLAALERAEAYIESYCICRDSAIRQSTLNQIRANVRKARGEPDETA